jgi:hypothetical protein
MLTEAQYAEQQRQLKRKIHEHDGIYWEQPYPFYCRPVFFMTAFQVGAAKPHPLKSMLGFSHQTTDSSKATDYKSFMELNREDLNDYSIQKLLPKKRSQVRQALKTCEVKLIPNLNDEVIERIRQINIEQAVRQESGYGAETPSARYIKEKEEWKEQIQREFSLHGREWWGAYYEGSLIAYIKTHQIGGIRIIEQTKTHTQYLKQKPMDALYYSIIEMASKESTCFKIINGTPLHPSLNIYKEQFLFKEVKYPYFSSNYKMVNSIKRLIGK